MSDQINPTAVDAGAAAVSAPGSAVVRACVQHPSLPSARRCDRCRAAMCELCDFGFSANLHVCPVCVADPGGAMTGKRIALAIAAIAVTTVSIAVLGALMSGMMVFESESSAGFAFTGLIFFPAALGLALGYGAMDRNRGNNALLWTASVLASTQLAVVFALIIYGNLKS
jgi:hypothetical protein